MSGRIILDTNIIISLFNGDNDIYEYIKQADEIFIPSIAIGELYYGAHKSLNSL
jgi:tRNA(fMet)-specific endonuclease VapC